MFEKLKGIEHALANFAESHGEHVADDYEKARTALVHVRELIVEYMPAHVEQPVIEQPVIEQPVIDQPVIEQPVIEQPVIEQPVIEQPVIEQPVIDQPVIDQPVIDQPVIEGAENGTN